jgi:phenylpyruvate tautomerase PptA (4-oxalocrotonate tautomerase family)
MPLYRCTVAKGLTSFEQRSLIAKEITRIHCEITGAPAEFVHAFFAEDADGQLPDGQQAFVLGSIRAGRTPAQKQQLASDMRRAVATILGRTEAEVTVVTVDVPARWIMEGGDILPEPGEEAAWLAKHG